MLKYSKGIATNVRIRKCTKLHGKYNQFQDSNVTFFVFNRFKHWWYEIKAEILAIYVIQLMLEKMKMMQLYVHIDRYIQYFIILQICILILGYVFYIPTCKQKEIWRQKRKTNRKNTAKEKGLWCLLLDVFSCYPQLITLNKIS